MLTFHHNAIYSETGSIVSPTSIGVDVDTAIDPYINTGGDLHPKTKYTLPSGGSFECVGWCRKSGCQSERIYAVDENTWKFIDIDRLWKNDYQQRPVEEW